MSKKLISINSLNFPLSKSSILLYFYLIAISYTFYKDENIISIIQLIVEIQHKKVEKLKN